MRLSLDRVAQPFVVFAERFYPDPFVFAIGLTALTFVLAVSITPTTATEALSLWGQGLTGLLAFITQVCLTLVCAHALAHTDALGRAIERVARWPERPYQAYTLVVLVAGIASLIAGALGLVVGGLIALAVGEQGRATGLRLHFPLLVASAYSGFMIWHMGYSGTVPLIVATPAHMLEAEMGIVPITETTFAAWNLGLAISTLLAVAFVCSLLAPADAEIIELTAPTLEPPEPPEQETASLPEGRTVGQRLEEARALSIGLGLLLVAYMISWFWKQGFRLTYDIVNWSFLASGLLLTRSPRHYVQLITNASRTVGPVILQYPFYAAVMALITQTELVEIFSDGFVAIASANTLGFWAFVSGGVLNVFVPSGGGQWAVQGPIFVEAARELGVASPAIVMGVAYGDQWTNMIQPFWTLPLLAIVGLKARAIMGYCFVVFLTGFVMLGGGLLLFGDG